MRDKTATTLSRSTCKSEQRSRVGFLRGLFSGLFYHKNTYVLPQLIEYHNVPYQTYADDTQLYIPMSHDYNPQTTLHQ